MRRLGKFPILGGEDNHVIRIAGKQQQISSLPKKVINQPYPKMLLLNLLITDTFLPA